MKKLHIFIKPLSISILSLLIVSAFFRYYLYINTTQMIREFKNQNANEIYTLDTFKVVSRLNSLSSVINWVCIEASVGQNSFYSRKKSSCETGLMQQRHVIDIKEADNFQIAFTIKLSKEVETLFIVFFIMQIFLIMALIISTKASEEEKRLIELKITKLAREISHDIRSPLSTLNTVLNFGIITDDNKDLMVRAIARINELTNDLLTSSKSHGNFSAPALITSKENINLLLTQIVDEKILEYQNFKNIHIILTNSESEIFCNINNVNFKRLISNLINNAIEAHDNMEEQIEVNLKLKQDSIQCTLEIIDNGIGISKDNLEKIGKENFTTKISGNGIGLKTAFDIVSNWNGKFYVLSEVNRGTTIKINIPLVFQKKINATILIDDDELVRLTWEYSAKKHNVNFMSFQNVDDFKKIVEHLEFDSTIHIDSRLSDNQRGENLAYDLHLQGYKSIYITSGYSKNYFSQFHFLKGIRDKSPPW